MSTPRVVRTAFLLVGSFFLLGAQCSDQIDQLFDALCDQDPTREGCSSLVFVTSTTHDGDLGGLAGADQICMDRASDAGMLDRTFRAWLSTTTVDAKDRLAEPRGQGWVRTDGALVATSIADLTDSSIANPIRFDESGSDVGSRLVRTGTKADGTLHSANTCLDYTTGSSAVSDRGGRTSDTNQWWTIVYGGACHHLRPLYCFEVPR